MKIKAVFLTSVLFLIFAPLSFGQQLTTIAVIDAQRVYDSFAKGDSLSAGIGSIQLRYQEQIDVQLVNIKNVEEQRRLIPSADILQVRDANARISLARGEIDRLNRLRTQEVRARQRFISPNNFIPELQRAIIFVAESRGYTVVLDAEDKGLQWWSPIVDITDDVIERLIVQISN